MNTFTFRLFGVSMILCPLTIIIIISGRFSFAASLAVVICTNTGVVGESTEITITFNTLCFCYYCYCRRVDSVAESNNYVITVC